MRPIPIKLRQEMSEDPFMHSCCLSKYGEDCSGKIEWHHNLQFAGRQQNVKFAILGLCKFHHDKIAYFKEKVDWVMVNRASDDELRSYSKAIDYIALRERLNKKYGKTIL